MPFSRVQAYCRIHYIQTFFKMTESSESEYEYFSCDEPPITRLVSFWGGLETSTQSIILDNGYTYKILKTLDSKNWLVSRNTDGRKYYIRIYGILETQESFDD